MGIEPSLDLASLAIFVRVAEMRSFTHAADNLGIQKSRASNVVRRIEEELGARLFHRSTRIVQLTEAGRAFHEQAAALLADAQELRSMFRTPDVALRGRLRVDLPSEIARTTLIPALPAFMAAHPEVELEVSTTDRQVDLVQEGIDCVVRLGPIGDDSLVAKRIGSLTMINAASPSYLARQGVPRTLADLASQGHRMVRFTSKFGNKSPSWEHPDGDGYAYMALTCALTVDNVQTYHAAGLAGLGLIQAGMSSLEPYLAEGELVEVLPDLKPAPLPASIVVAHRRNLTPSVRGFTHWLEGVLRPYLHLARTPQHRSQA